MPKSSSLTWLASTARTLTEVKAPTGAVQEQRQLRLADGTYLVASCWHPAAGGPWPALLMRQPYGRAIASTVVYAHPAWYAARGYLVVIQDVRGCGDSGGTFRLFANEAQDGSETLAWLRAQPDCNGKVGCYGFSYQGLSQLLWDGPDVPDCTAPAMAGLDLQQHWCQDGAAPWWCLGLAWALQLAAARSKRQNDGATWNRIRRALDSGRFLHDGWLLLQDADPDNHLLRWWSETEGDADAMPWPAGGVNAVLRRPMLIIGGWYDPALRGSLDLQQRSRQAGGTPQTVVGPWTHLDWHDSDVDQQQLAFFDRHLKAQPAAVRSRSGGGPEDAVQLFDVGRQQWRGWADWPATKPWAWCLRGEGLSAVKTEAGELLPASEEASVAGGWDRLVFDPWRPTPASGGHLDLQAGPVDRTGLDRRSDVLTFTSAPLQQPLPLCGAACLRIRAASEGNGFDICGTLGLLHGDGGAHQRVEQLCMGVNRWCGSSARHMAWREVRFQPLLCTLPAGQRLRLSVALGAWPLIGINPGDGCAPHAVASHERRVVVVTFDWHEARFSLPLLA